MIPFHQIGVPKYDEFIRADAQCGPNNPLDDGSPAKCDPNGDAFCCSEWGFCGSTDSHCKCDKCVDFRNQTLLTDWLHEIYLKFNSEIS